MAIIYDKGPGEKTVILDIRETLNQPFTATDWLDLRIGFFLSVCSTSPDDDVIDAGPMAETIALPLGDFDRYFIGVINQSTRTFMGYTNWQFRGRQTSTSVMKTSDGGIGTSNTDYWRALAVRSGGVELPGIAAIMDNGLVRAQSNSGAQTHLVQDYSGGHAAGYASLWAMRLQRDDPRGRGKIIKMTVKSGVTWGDVIFTSTPSKEVITAQLESFPTGVQTLGPVEVPGVPDRLVAYWPFHSSRLRIHSCGIVKVN